WRRQAARTHRRAAWLEGRPVFFLCRPIHRALRALTAHDRSAKKALRRRDPIRSLPGRRRRSLPFLRARTADRSWAFRLGGRVSFRDERGRPEDTGRLAERGVEEGEVDERRGIDDLTQHPLGAYTQLGCALPHATTHHQSRRIEKRHRVG